MVEGVDDLLARLGSMNYHPDPLICGAATWGLGGNCGTGERRQNQDGKDENSDGGIFTLLVKKARIVQPGME